jgi:2-C-methyl-D-erythritol 2,4-cyclodiphosphate synthase
MNFRIGHGYDVHAFELGRPLKLGGVSVPHKAGLAAHSDGDVVIHALCDALLGAAALGDIGRHFPDTSAEYHNIDSRLLLQKVVQLLQKQGLQISNVDLTIVAQEPKLSAYIQQMRETLAADLHSRISDVNVKATTTEQLGFIGRCEGVSCHAVALLYSEQTDL